MLATTRRMRHGDIHKYIPLCTSSSLQPRRNCGGLCQCMQLLQCPIGGGCSKIPGVKVPRQLNTGCHLLHCGYYGLHLLCLLLTQSQLPVTVLLLYVCMYVCWLYRWPLNPFTQYCTVANVCCYCDNQKEIVNFFVAAHTVEQGIPLHHHLWWH